MKIEQTDPPQSLLSGWATFLLSDRSGARLRLLLRDRRMLYIMSGSVIFGINVVLAAVMFAVPFSGQPHLNNNIANIITTELMVIISFVIHNSFTWSDVGGRMLPKLFRFHLASALSLTLRTAAFAGLDYLGFHFLVSTVISIALILVFNFVSFDRFAFRATAAANEGLLENPNQP